MEGNNADRSCVQSKTSSWMKNENKKKLIPESGQKLRVSELFNCLIYQNTCELLEISSLD